MCANRACFSELCYSWVTQGDADDAGLRAVCATGGLRRTKCQITAWVQATFSVWPADNIIMQSVILCAAGNETILTDPEREQGNRLTPSLTPRVRVQFDALVDTSG